MYVILSLLYPTAIFLTQHPTAHRTGKKHPTVISHFTVTISAIYFPQNVVFDNLEGCLLVRRKLKRTSNLAFYNGLSTHFFLEKECFLYRVFIGKKNLVRHGVPPSGGRLEYLHSGPGSRRRRRKGNPVSEDITGPPCSMRDINTGTWSSRLGVGRKADELAL
jgi:hypothetical protein